MTGNFDVVSVSAAASTGIMDLRTAQWSREMLDALANPVYRDLAWSQLPRIIDQFEPVGRFSASVCAEAGLDPATAPWSSPRRTISRRGWSAAGAVDAGQVAVILGSSAVVNSSADRPPASDDLDCMRLNWDPYLWMRCYTNGAQFFNHVLGAESGLCQIGGRGPKRASWVQRHICFAFSLSRNPHWGLREKVTSGPLPNQPRLEQNSGPPWRRWPI